MEVEFRNLLFLSEYTIYYVIANEFPLRPILDSNVYTMKVNIHDAPKPSGDIIMTLSFMLIVINLLFLSF